MSLPSLNATQQAQILEVLFKSTASSVAPLMLLESFMIGVLCACVPLASYMLWTKSISFPRAPSISMLWIIWTAMMIHWSLSLRHLESTLAGRSLEMPLVYGDLWSAIEKAESDIAYESSRANIEIGYSYAFYGTAWRYLLPLLIETALFGFASFLFVCMVYISYGQSSRRSCSAIAIPATASLMYIISLTHWAISLRCFILAADVAVINSSSSFDSHALDAALLVLLSSNAVMSDSIVLWRTVVVWNRTRTILAFGAALLLTTLGLNIANIVAQTSVEVSLSTAVNSRDPEFLGTYGQTSIGLAAAFISLTSNLCATVLVGVKVWLHRIQIAKYLHSDNGRTLVQRFMEILVDSGAVYTAIWLLYCISFFRVIASEHMLGTSSQNDLGDVTVASYLDFAMAQITCIYPLAIFILVALDNIHHSRGPQMLRNDWPKERSPVEAVTISFEIDVERSTAPISGSAGPMVEAFRLDDTRKAEAAAGEVA